MIALLLVLLLGFEAAPAPTPPPTIIHERVSPVCTTLHELVLPLARVQTQYRHHLAQIRADEQLFAKYSTDKISTNMFAFQIDMEASNIIESLHQIELLMIKSYDRYPQGKSPKVDALRQHVQNIVDLERATADRYVATFGSIVDSAGINDIQNSVSAFGINVASGAMNSPAGGGMAPGSVIIPTPLPPVETPQPAIGRRMQADSDPRISSTPPPGVPARMLKFYGLSELRDSLRSEGRQLIQQALVAARDCDGA